MRHLPALLVWICLCAVAVGGRKTKDEVLANFAGVLKRVTRHEIVIEPDPDNQIRFIRTKRTRFISGAKDIDGAALPREIVVNVQAFEKLNRELEAVTVTVAVPESSAR